MKITCHVMNCMFKHYRIVDRTDVEKALEQRAFYETEQLTAAKAKAELEAAAASATRASDLAKTALASTRLQ